MSSARAVHILVKSEKLARELIKLLAKGEPFSKLAKKHSMLLKLFIEVNSQ